jgi:TPR repeat protein
MATVATVTAGRVIELLEGCAAAGHADAQAILGLWYLRGKQLVEDQPLALAWITRAAQGGHALAQAVLGDMLVLGLGVMVDTDGAALWYERAALQGHAGAITALVSLRMAGRSGVAAVGGIGAGGGVGARGDGGARSDQKSQVFQLWLRAAEQGQPGAQRMVGQFYLRGIGTPISQAEGRRWLAAASRQGDAGAMVLLGGLLLRQADDLALAAELFRRAAARGNIDAHYNLGECLRLGLGVPRDDAKAERLYAAAAQHGHVLAQQALGVLKARSAGAAGAGAEAVAEPAAEPAVEPGAQPIPEPASERRDVAIEPG